MWREHSQTQGVSNTNGATAQLLFPTVGRFTILRCTTFTSVFRTTLLANVVLMLSALLGLSATNISTSIHEPTLLPWPWAMRKSIRVRRRGFWLLKDAALCTCWNSSRPAENGRIVPQLPRLLTAAAPRKTT